MLDPDAIVDAARRRWPAVLRAEARGEDLFPLRIAFGRPRTTADFSTLRRGIEALAAAQHEWRIDWEEVRTRKWGRQRWPVQIAFDSAERLAAAIGRSGELRSFRAALEYARATCPPLEPWLRRSGHRVVDYLGEWSQLVAVCAYFDAHPRPNCYARQVAVPVGTKFIEEQAGILRELLDVVLGDRVNAAATTFHERFHLRVEPPQVRFRFLDSNLGLRNGWPVSDCSVPAPVFAALSWGIPRVLIVENRDVFLCLPAVPDTLAVFGSGKAAALFQACRWMNSSQIIYWGDCDEAGYGILSDLRSHFPHVQSLLMDIGTWSRWKHLAVPGRRDATARHTSLSVDEMEVFKVVSAGQLMLEQERIPVQEAEQAIKSVIR